MMKARFKTSVTSHNIYDIINPLRNLKGRVSIYRGMQSANAKSLLSLIALDIKYGDVVDILVTEPSEFGTVRAAFAPLVEYIKEEE